MLGHSPAFQRLSMLIDKYAGCDASVLIEGETGTGKEVAARAIHYGSARHNMPFVPINCGAIPETLIESELFGHKRGAFTDARTDQAGVVEVADGGTLFLDEVDTLPLKAQVALLRFLQEYEYRPIGGRTPRRADVRLIAATNADLHQLIETRRFRLDLYYRLSVLSLCVPPLRARGDDVLELADHYLNVACSNGPRRSFDEYSRGLLLAYNWPGNIRELENVVYRAALFSTAPSVTLDGADIGHHDQHDEGAVATDAQWNFRASRRAALEAFERRFACRLLAATRGNVSHAAALAGKERRALGRMLRKYGIDRLTFR